MSNCKVCLSGMRKAFVQKVLDKYDVQYYFCDQCGVLQTEKPYWLEEAYADAIANADTGLVQRNSYISKKLTVLLYFLYGNNSTYVDSAGGTGLLVRMMRDVGFDFYWYDLYCENIHAKGFEFNSVTTLPFTCSAVTAFEVLEHVEEPIDYIKSLLDKTQAKTLIFSTELFDGEPPGDWWYYAKETGQHITFYQIKTLKTIAAALDLKLYSYNNFHMMTFEHFSEFKFKIAVGPLSKLIFPIVKNRMNSKTLSDHEIQLKKHGR